MAPSRAGGDDPGMAQASRRRARKNETDAGEREASGDAPEKSAPIVADDIRARKRRACERMRREVTTL
jgi:hypothetical protein